MATPEEIRSWMRSRKMTQQELADQCHTVRATINRLLQGRPVSAVIRSHVELLMEDSRKLALQLPAETESYLRAEADRTGQSVEEFTLQLLRDAMLQRAIAPLEDRSDGLEAAKEPLE